jgi:hypothetical protein
MNFALIVSVLCTMRRACLHGQMEAHMMVRFRFFLVLQLCVCPHFQKNDFEETYVMHVLEGAFENLYFSETNGPLLFHMRVFVQFS